MSESIDELREFSARHRRLWFLTGAGCSTGSGIPDYRDRDGQWKRKPPVTLQAFVGDVVTRQRYWARSLIGWPLFAQALPNEAHHALVRLQQQGRVAALITQNVDRLHQCAGSREVIDLHGRLDQVVCLNCKATEDRDTWQLELIEANQTWSAQWRAHAVMAPDGDADLNDAPFESFSVPACRHCGGVLKPDVVFFGETVPRARVDAALLSLQTCDAVLIVGSSLMVYSGFRFARAASELGLPVVAISLGKTRADDLLEFRLQLDCSSALAALSP